MSNLTPVEASNKRHDFFRERLIPELKKLQVEAHEAGVPIMAKALNEAMNKCGWEFAELLEKNL
jgi:alpha-glucosidase (family GH31 glycosyl hydrolase)